MQRYVRYSIKVWPVSVGTRSIGEVLCVHCDLRHVVRPSEVVRPRFRCVIKLGKCSKRLNECMGIYTVLMPSVLY